MMPSLRLAVSLAPPPGVASTIFCGCATRAIRGAIPQSVLARGSPMQSQIRGVRIGPATVGLVVGLLAYANTANALPPGRAWTPIAELHVPGFTSTVAPRMEVSVDGRPFLVTLTRSPSDVLTLDWSDSSWVERWRLGRGTITLWPVQSPAGTHYLIWKGLGPIANERLFMASVLQTGVQEPDTVAQVQVQSVEYSGAVSAKRQWAVINDLVANGRRLRVRYSDALGIWNQVPNERAFDLTDGVAIAPTGDFSAVVAWSETFQVHWATVDGSQWAEGQPFPGTNAARMQFRRRPSGGQWFAWGGYQPNVFLRTFRDGGWSPPETLRCAYRDGLPNHYTETPDMSRDDGEYPVIVWDAQNIRANNTICASVPTDAGYSVAEELEGVEGDLGLPSVARDRNGDVWIAYWVVGEDARWLHSYVRATAVGARAMPLGSARKVLWNLSEPAPETWWAVLRSQGAGPFESVARVRASSGVEMSWTDTTPPVGPLRYKVRRESVDARYLWESAPLRVPELVRTFALRPP